MIKTVIIDDEPGAIEMLEGLCAEYADRLVCVGSARKYIDAVELISNEQPDLVFLDIEMPTGSGFDLLNHFQSGGKVPFHVVFITAFEKYALKAIKHHALDYILKPIDLAEFERMVLKVCELKRGDTHLGDFLKNKQPEKIGLPTSAGTRYLSISEIVRVQADGSYTQVVTDDGVIVVCRMLKDFEKGLNGSNFLRVHRAHLINLDHLVSLNRDEGNYALMTNKDRVPISRRDKDRVQELVTQMAKTV